MKYLLILALLFIGCEEVVKSKAEMRAEREAQERRQEQEERKKELKLKYEMNCIYVQGVYRCENIEAVCYMSSWSSEAGISCNFKEVK